MNNDIKVITINLLVYKFYLHRIINFKCCDEYSMTVLISFKYDVGVFTVKIMSFTVNTGITIFFHKQHTWSIISCLHSNNVMYIKVTIMPVCVTCYQRL